MKIGFDARMLDHPGIGRYIRSLLAAMPAAAKDYEFVLYGNLSELTDFKSCRKKEYTTPIYSWREFFSSPFGKDEFDLVHIPHFNAPFQKINRLVITIHDLIYLRLAESVPNWLKGLAAAYAVKRAVEKADRIIAVSENTKKDIIERWPKAKEKIRVVYEAADSLFKKISDEDKKEGIRRKYRLPHEIILFVGSLKKHKNIERLLEAYTSLKSRGIRHRLVIIGRYSPGETGILRKIESTDALYPGEVPIQDLVVIYNLADLLVIPSLYEGFGLPALEAMACGVAVASSSASSLPEVVGEAGILFDPYDISDISDKVYQVLMDKGLRQDLIEKGFKRVGDFSWEKTAEQTLDVYREVLSYLNLDVERRTSRLPVEQGRTQN